MPGGGHGVLLADVLDSLPPGIRSLSRPSTEDAARAKMVRWIEASELDDPTPYLVDGEFVLTTGLQFLGADAGRAAMDRYVGRLVEARVCALGFGLQPYFETVPEELVEACDAQGLLLVEIPERIPFAAIGMHVAQLLEARTLEVLRELSDSTRSLLRAALAEQSSARVLDTLADRAGVNALLVGPDGALQAAAGGGSPPDIGQFSGLLERLFAGRGPRIEIEHLGISGFGSVTAYPLRDHQDATIGAVLIGADAPVARVQRSIVDVALSLLEALESQRGGGALAPGLLAARLLLQPKPSAPMDSTELPPLDSMIAECAGGADGGSFRVVLGVHESAWGAPARAWSPGHREVTQWRRVFATSLIMPVGSRLCAITRSGIDAAVVDEAERGGWRLIVSEPVETERLPDAFCVVTSLERKLLDTQRTVFANEVPVSVVELLGEGAGRTLAAELLGPLLALDAERGRELVRVLRSWLEANGGWDAAARALDLHRNSVRRHVIAIEQLLGVDLQDARTRAELLIALRFFPPVR